MRTIEEIIAELDEASYQMRLIHDRQDAFHAAAFSEPIVLPKQRSSLE